MKEITVKGRSLDEISKHWAQKWGCSPEDLRLSVIKKPRLINRNWHVKVEYRERVSPKDRGPKKVGVIWDGAKYTLFPPASVMSIVPFPLAGRLLYNGQEVFEEVTFYPGDKIEYYPVKSKGEFSWELQISQDGSRAVAKVKHERPGRYVLKKDIDWRKKWFLANDVRWEEDSNWYFQPEWEQALRDELAAKGIIHGIKPDYWQKIRAVNGVDEVTIAEQTNPVLPVHPMLEDFFEINKEVEAGSEEVIDYFASKLLVCEQNDILARKIPGKEGVPGRDIFGKVLPVERMHDFQLRAGENAYLNANGLEVRAQCSGSPLKLKNNIYAVEKVHLVKKDVDLDTGSIEFPGDVIVAENVQDGLHVFANGRISVQGMVSGAELKAEGGIIISKNVFNSSIIVGEKHYQRSQFITLLKRVEEDLRLLMCRLEELQSLAPKSGITYKQLFHAVMEKQFAHLPANIQGLTALLKASDEDFYTREIIIAIHTLKCLMEGISYFELKDNSYLLTSLKDIHYFLQEKDILIPEKVAFVAGYVQNSQIKTSGDFICRKDMFNSDIRAEGDIKIFGTCRASKLISGNKIFVYELGSMEGGDDTLVILPPAGHLSAEYCHPNVKIFLGKEYVPIEQSCHKLDIYIENGRLWVDKLKNTWDLAKKGI
jgi:hypothetical protein